MKLDNASKIDRKTDRVKKYFQVIVRGVLRKSDVNV